MTDRVTEFLAKAATAPVELSIRDLLTIWGFRTRTYDSVGRIQRDLSAAGLRCQPDFTEGPTNAVVRIGPSARAAAVADETPPGDMPALEGVTGDAASSADQPLELPPFSLRVRDIPSATTGIVTVHPDETLELAQGRMIAQDYSQLAVTTGPKDLKGAVSWMTIAKAHLAKSRITLADVIDRYPKVVRADQDLLGQIATIYAADFVFVQDADYTICGIVTTADLSRQFQGLTTPFFQLGEIEGRLRHCIEKVFGIEEIRQATRQRRLESVNAMTFAQYRDLLNDQARWQRMHWNVDRDMFISYLDDARKLRNRVMHFGTRLQDEEERKLTACLSFMRHLDPQP